MPSAAETEGFRLRLPSAGEKEILVLAVFLIPEATFYIFPVEGLPGRTSLSLPCTQRRNGARYAQYCEACHLREPSAWTPDQIPGVAPAFHLSTVLEPPLKHVI